MPIRFRISFSAWKIGNFIYFPRVKACNNVGKNNNTHCVKHTLKIDAFFALKESVLAFSYIKDEKKESVSQKKSDFKLYFVSLSIALVLL